MNRVFLGGLLCFILLSINIASGAGKANAQSDKNSVSSISVAYCSDCVPFHFKNEQGNPDGLMIDLWRRWSEITGIKLKFMAAGWDDTLRMVADGRADAHAGLFYNEVRAGFLEYGLALAQTDTHYFHHKDLKNIRGLEDLTGHTVGVLAGDYVEGYLKQHLPDANIVGFDTYEALMKSLHDGKVRVFAADTPTGLFHLQKTGQGFNFALDVENPLYRNRWHVAVKKNDAALIRMIDAGMGRISSSERDAIKKRWIAIGETDFRFDLVAYVGGGIAFVLMLALLWNWRLRREMSGRRREDNARRAILESISLPILVVREDNAEILFVNDAATGDRPTSELIGLPAGNIYEDPAQRLKLARTMSENGRVDAVEVQLNVAGTGFIWALISSRRIEFGGHPAFLTTWSEITELKAAHEEITLGTEILETTMNSVDQGIVMIDAGHRIVAANNRYAELTWMTPGYLETRPLWVDMMREAARLNWFGDIDTEELIAKQLAARSGATEPEIHDYRRSDGVELEFWSRALPGGGWVQSVTDVTERLRTQHALEKAKEDAEAATAAKSEFVAVVSHEVRTPMNGVLGMARLMLDTPLSKKQRDFARTIVDSGEALLTILNDLLDISKLEAGKLELEDIDFSPAAVIKDAIDIWTPRTREKGLSLTTKNSDGVPAVLLGDANRLRQILLNLVSNAVKFTARGEVAIHVDGAVLADKRYEMRITVADTGIGVSADAANKMFQPYTQADASTARKYGGTGLGLSICRRLVDLMGGTIVLASEVDKGSTFTLTLPFSISDQDAAAFEQTQSPSGGTLQDVAGIGLRVLIVEDNLINLKVAENMVGNLGHLVTTVENGREAVDMLADGAAFDVILMDRHMPILGGIEATREIRQMDGAVRTIPIIAVTAAVTELEIQTCLDAGMDEVVSKPIDPAELVAALGRVALKTEEKLMSGRTEMSTADIVRRQPTVDPEVLARMRRDFGDDVLAELVDDFKLLGAESISGFGSATAAKDSAAMQRRAHDLKTNAATLGLARLSELARDVEILSADGEVELARDRAAGFEALFADALTALAGSDLDHSDGGGEDESLTLFLAKMAHDLRNNLNVILGNTRMLQDIPADAAPDSLDEYAREIRGEGADILNLSEDILALTQIETGRYVVTPGAVDLRQTIAGCVAVANELGAKRGVSIDPADIAESVPQTVTGDPATVSRMFGHVLANAVRVSPENGDVRVRITADAETLSVAVTDDGPGISAENIALVRSPFARIWETDGQEGRGLLLFNVVDRLAGAHGGTLTIDSKPGTGTTATVVLPSVI